jgi:hypothetical protein
MASTQFKVTIGEETATYTVKPKHILKSERLGKADKPVESTYHLAWYASGTELGFEEWMDIVDEIEPILPDDAEDEGDEAVPPTTGGSRRSRPTPE